MKILFSHFLLLLCLLLGCGGKEDAENINVQTKGHETGNGTDNKDPDPGAWVLGENSEITYCVISSKDFGVPREKILEEIKKAFKTWQDYIISKGINLAIEETYLETFKYGPRTEITEEDRLRRKIFHLPLRSRLLQSCGSANVAFFLGFENDLVSNFKRKYKNPTAFAEIYKADSLSGSNKGIVWLAKDGGLGNSYPDWSWPNRLLGILIHEIGHVYGASHKDGTIMQEDMRNLLQRSTHTPDSPRSAANRMARIDHDRELYAIRDYKKLDLRGVLTSCSKEEGEVTFEDFTSKAPKGKYSVRLTKGVLTLKDEDETFEFLFEVDTTLPTSATSSFIFHRSWERSSSGDNGNIWFPLYTLEEVLVGEIESKDGKRYKVTLERNYWYPIKMSYVKDGKTRSLMYVDLNDSCIEPY